MGSLAFRDAVVSKLVGWAEGRTDFRLYLENGPKVDMDTEELPVVAVQIVYAGSEQADLNADPLLRDDGAILVTVLVKDMTGMRTGYRLRDEAASLLQRQNLGGATTRIGRKLPNSDLVKGWTGYRVAVPFWHFYTV